MVLYLIAASAAVWYNMEAMEKYFCPKLLGRKVITAGLRIKEMFVIPDLTITIN
jgi:hypothetical protein